MYSSCLVCHADLGKNESITAFPVGRRIAFAPDEGRLWAICDACGEWNLAPIVERWEAVEECAAEYEATLARASLDGVSIAEGKDLTLLRIGPGDELPTLRYGERIAARQRSHSMKQRIAGLAKTMFVIGTVVLGGLVGGFNGAVIVPTIAFVLIALAAAWVDPMVTRVPIAPGKWTEVTRRELHDVRLVPVGDRGWALRLRKGLELGGPEALEAARFLLPLITRSEEPREDLRKALRYVEKKGGTTDSVFAAGARRRGRERTARVAKLEPHIRLALEMLASRDVESRALSGDFGHLEQAWRNADELAEIQDELIYGPGMMGKLRALKG